MDKHEASTSRTHGRAAPDSSEAARVVVASNHQANPDAPMVAKSLLAISGVLVTVLSSDSFSSRAQRGAVLETRQRRGEISAAIKPVQEPFVVTTLVSGLDTPWHLAWGPDGKL